jgi:hypothetical protein
MNFQGVPSDDSYRVAFGLRAGQQVLLVQVVIQRPRAALAKARSQENAAARVVLKFKILACRHDAPCDAATGDHAAAVHAAAKPSAAPARDSFTAFDSRGRCSV